MMSLSFKPRILPLLLLLFFYACNEQAPPADSQPAVIEIQTSADSLSQVPFLYAGANDSLCLSWLRQVDSTNWALEYSVLDNDNWTPVREVMARSDLFVNWADFPSIVVGENGQKAFHWLQKSGEGTYAYDVRFKLERISESIVPHDDGTATEHGFVSILPQSGGGFLLHWLDGRNYAADKKEMTLRAARISSDGAISDEAIVDERVCDCCQTDAALIPGGSVIVYRDRSDDEIRDISIARRIGNEWEAPKSIWDDNWKIAGCPVNGPAVSAHGAFVAVAWFTGARDIPTVLLAVSKDGGANFDVPIRVDDGNPLGRVDVEIRADKSIWVSWLEQEAQAVNIRLKSFTPAGNEQSALTAATTSAERRSGFPRMAATNKDLYLALTDVSGGKMQVKLARVRLDSKM